MNIYSWLENNAHEMPEKVCIKFKGKDITFSELDAHVRTMGTKLRKAGIKRGDHLTMVLPNTPEFMITYMASAATGAVVTLVNPAYTPRELLHILSDSDSKGLVIQNSAIEKYAEIEKSCPQDFVITTGENGNFNEWITGSGDILHEEMDKDDPAIMIYSSGLTGYPMGAMITHGNLDHQSDMMRLCMNCDETDTTLALIPCFHSFSSSVNMLSMLRYGGCMYVMDKLDFGELHYALTEGGVTAIGAVPTLFFGLLHQPDLADIDYTKMKALISGGSALPREIYDAFKQKFHVDIRQGYGITEASPTCAVNNIHSPIKPESLGPVVPGVQSKVIDKNGLEVPAGTKGQLLFKGPNIMKGYYNRPEETADILKDGWLHTGDIGYRDEDGYLYITGYIKDMVITSGFNVYSREVEGVLNSIPGVRDSAITGIPDLVRGSIIKAYVVSDDPALTEKEIKRLAKRELAKYKTPRKVVIVDEIPRTTGGRPDFGALED